MIALADLGVIIMISLASALVVGLVGLAVLRWGRGWSMLVQLCVVVLAAILSVIVGMIAVAQAMYLSGHDLIVTMYVAAVSAVVSLGIAVFLGWTFVRNSHQLQTIARAVGAGEIVEPGAHGSGEFARLAGELSATSIRLAQARDEVARLDASRRDLVAWISHDLRTPLAGLRAMAEALEDGMVDDPTRYHQQIQSQVDHLSDMVDDLFELSKIQSGTLPLSLEPVVLYDLISDAVSELRPIADARSITLRESQNADLTVIGDARELSRVVGNLLMNAIQYSPAGSEIRLSASVRDDHHAVLSVVDAGGGIPEEDLSRVFEAGWRASTSRTPERTLGRSTGAGLGLAIVHGIVQAHSGGITVRNVPGGCRFDVLLTRLLVSGRD